MIIAVVEDRPLSILAGTFAATIAAKDIEHSFHALTHFPERRTLSELEGLAERLNGFAAYMVELWEQAKLPLPDAGIGGLCPPSCRDHPQVLGSGRPLHELVYHRTCPLSRRPQ
ncbi:hypothetical protein [Rhizobium sp. SAFR-030]|uniref:hypothetical protein n=1 Tax=Rhizobium sp. SAFR-030 TaxID=3387277 RepID=UPI003F7D86E5